MCQSSLLSYEYFTQKIFYYGAYKVRNLTVFIRPKDMADPVQSVSNDIFFHSPRFLIENTNFTPPF